MAEINAPFFNVDQEKNPAFQQNINPQQISNPISSNLTWVSVLNFLQKQHTKSLVQQQEWQMQKRMLNQKINRLQAEVDINKTINTDLINRIKLLQISLIHSRRHGQNKSIKNQNKAEIQQQIEKLLKQFQTQEKIKEGGHEKFIKQIMSDIGVTFQDISIVQQDNFPQFNLKNSYSLFRNKNQFLLSQQGSTVLHLDAVRGLMKDHGHNFVISISQDCLVKIWDYQKLWKNKNNHLEPKKVFREHTGPLFSLAGGTNIENPEQTIFFTGGSEGIIRSWVSKKDSQFTTYPLSSWQSQSKNDELNKTVWSLSFLNNNILTADSHGSIQHLRFSNAEQDENKQMFTKLAQYRQKQFNSTYVKWLSNQNFITNCANAPRLHLWNTKSSKVVSKLIYQIEKGIQPITTQVNQLCYSSTLNLVAGGCQDGFLRLFSLSNDKLIRKIKIGNNTNIPISCLDFVKEWEIVCGNHSGALFQIDLRNYQILKQKSNCHSKKYDESIFCLLNKNCQILSGGADGIVKHWK